MLDEEIMIVWETRNISELWQQTQNFKLSNYDLRQCYFPDRVHLWGVVIWIHFSQIEPLLWRIRRC